jgi:hypothetical protein
MLRFRQVCTRERIVALVTVERARPKGHAYSSRSLLSRNGGIRLNNIVVFGDYLTYIIEVFILGLMEMT